MVTITVEVNGIEKYPVLLTASKNNRALIKKKKMEGSTD